MDTRIQFRVDEETKRLAQQMAESQGRTLSDACRELTEQLADQQRKTLSHDAWLTEQVNLALRSLTQEKPLLLTMSQLNLVWPSVKLKSVTEANYDFVGRRVSQRSRKDLLSFYDFNPEADKTDDIIEAKLKTF